MTELADPEAEPDRGSGADCERAETVVAHLQNRGERVRRRELETALRRLEARGELTPAERRVVTDLAADLTDSLVERWTANPDAEDVDLDAVLALLAE